ncbi:hypothetical protein D3C87_1951880 [compost metagenome]
MIVKLQRDAENVVALAFEQAGDDGTVDATGHGNDDTRIFGLAVKIETVHGIQSGLRAATLRLPCFTLHAMLCRGTLGPPHLRLRGGRHQSDA